MANYRFELTHEEFQTVLHCLAATERRFAETGESPYWMSKGVRETLERAAARCRSAATHMIDSMHAL